MRKIDDNSFYKVYYLYAPDTDAESDIMCGLCLSLNLEEIEDNVKDRIYHEIIDYVPIEETDELRFNEPWEIECDDCGAPMEDEPEDEPEDAGCRRPCGMEPMGCASCADRGRG